MSEMDNLPAYAGALIGFRRDGRPIYLAAGGAPEDDDTQVDEDASETEAEPADDDGDEEIDYKAKYEAQKAINRRLEQRQKNQAAKAKPAKAAAKQQADDEPDERDQRVAAAEAAAADAQMQLHVNRLLTKNGYDADQLLDSNKFLDAVNGLDVDEDTSEDEFNEMVLELAATFGRKATGGGRHGVDMSGGGNGPGRPASIKDAMSRTYGT